MFDTYRAPYSPLPGTTPAPRALFVDRWGTLLATPERGFAACAGDVTFLPGTLNALFRAVRSGWKVYLLGNEDAVAYGEISPAQWKEIVEHVHAKLAGAGVLLERDYSCTTRPDGVPGQVADSVYLLPNTGAFYHAVHEDGIDLAKSWVIGDSTLELVAGWRAGCRQAGVRTGLGLSDRTFDVEPELIGDDLATVIDVLLDRAALSA